MPSHGDAPKEILDRYVEADVRLTQFLHLHCASRIDGQEDVLDLERRLLPAVYATQQRGVPIDVDAAKRFRQETAANVVGLLAKLRDLAGDDELNPASAKQLEEAFVSRSVSLDDVPRTEKTAQAMFTAQTLGAIDDDLARAVLEYRAEKKARDYADGVFRRTHGDRLYGTFRQVGASTGRMSSGQPNLQNFPREDDRVRNIIRAGEGMVLVGADLAAVELRILAHLAPGGALEEAFTAGEDPHQQTADALGIERSAAKTLNFAVLYGSGVRNLSEQLDCSGRVLVKALTGGAGGRVQNLAAEYSVASSWAELK